MTGDSGFVPDPGSEVCEAFVRVRFHEADALGHVNNAAYLNYLEQAAIDHATLLGLNLERLRGLGGVFVARRHEMVFLRPAHAGDVLRIVTWLEQARGARVDRRYVVFREAGVGLGIPLSSRLRSEEQVAMEGDRVAQASTEWVFTTELGQPHRIPGEISASFHSRGIPRRKNGDDADEAH